MSVQIKNFNVAGFSIDNRGDASAYNNRIPLDACVYDLYIAPNVPAATPSPSVKAAIVKCIRIINSHTAPVLIDLYYTTDVVMDSVPVLTQCHRRSIAPPGMRLSAGYSYIDECDLTLEPGGRIQAKAWREIGAPDNGLVIEYIISGVERDVTV